MNNQIKSNLEYNPKNFYCLEEGPLSGQSIQDVVPSIQKTALAKYKSSIVNMEVPIGQTSKYQQQRLDQLKHFEEITKPAAINIALHTYAASDFESTRQKLQKDQRPEIIKRIITDKKDFEAIFVQPQGFIDGEDHQKNVLTYATSNLADNRSQAWESSLDELDQLDNQMKELITPNPIKPNFFARCKQAVRNIFSTKQAPIFGLETKLNESILEKKMDATSATFESLRQTQTYKDAQQANDLMNGKLITTNELNSLCKKGAKDLYNLLKCAKLLKMAWAESISSNQELKTALKTNFSKIQAEQDAQAISKIISSLPRHNQPLREIDKEILQNGIDTLTIDLPRMTAEISIGAEKFTVHQGSHVNAGTSQIDFSQNHEVLKKFFEIKANDFCNAIEKDMGKRPGLLNALYFIPNQFIQNETAQLISLSIDTLNYLAKGTNKKDEEKITVEYDTNTNEIKWKREFILDIANRRIPANQDSFSVERSVRCTAESTIKKNKEGNWELHQPITYQFPDYPQNHNNIESSDESSDIAPMVSSDDDKTSPTSPISNQSLQALIET